MKKTYRGDVWITLKVSVHSEIEEGNDIPHTLTRDALEIAGGFGIGTFLVDTSVTDWKRVEDDH